MLGEEFWLGGQHGSFAGHGTEIAGSEDDLYAHENQLLGYIDRGELRVQS